MAPDALFADPRLAPLYDLVEGDRDDLDAYVALADELGAQSVLDVGCGTGELACRFAARGRMVTAVDPAAASLRVAAAKPHAGSVRWIESDATVLPPLDVDLATMTGNVAQVFVDDDDWTATLRGIGGALRPGGHLVFETRDPRRRAWEEWTPDRTRSTVRFDGHDVETWCDVLRVKMGADGGVVTFRWTYVVDDETLTSDSTLRFRSRETIDASLAANGFDVLEVRDAPDRPGKEFVFVARRRLDR
ncbi:MAG: class I SAM-dependent methyltransferase [Ilumatobacter sp.]|uniref:class I SAM-dependent methyltransferase n=1 Tax=Ilumatobacter sp. TaxID=1967498 RepID=UPI0026305377|nr:class I SAM-dependent methyltransferase [Ilumatobacter sp.]MDJ0769376.1 class I SAM-dependent methyltransferase [Ilumatobacter sp.]